MIAGFGKGDRLDFLCNYFRIDCELEVAVAHDRVGAFIDDDNVSRLPAELTQLPGICRCIHLFASLLLFAWKLDK